MDFAYFMLTLAAALGMGYLGMRLKLPSGALVGAIVGVVIVNLTVGKSFFYEDIKVVLQVLSGAMIGSKIGMSDVREMKKIILPTVFLLFGMVLLNIVFGGSIYLFSSLGVATSLFATAPGGMADMAIIASDLGANPGYVAILQLLRILIIFIFMPPIFKKILSKRSYERAEAEEGTQQGGTVVPRGVYLRKLGLLFLVCAAGGLLMRALGVTAGALTGSMLAGTLLCVFRGKVLFPGSLRFLLQIVSGAFIGVGFDRAMIMTLPDLAVPVLIMIVGIFAFVFTTSFLMHKLFKIDLAVCLLSSTPGGVQEMALLSEDLGADTPKIAIMQTIRLMSVIILFPTMIGFITRMFVPG